MVYCDSQSKQQKAETKKNKNPAAKFNWNREIH